MDTEAECCESMECENSDGGMKIGVSPNGTMSSMNTESKLPMSDPTSVLSKHCDDDTQVVFDLERCFYYSISISDDICWIGEYSLDIEREIFANWKNKRLEEYERNKAINVHYTQGIIDMDANGRRWEGGVKDGQPYGYGVFYDDAGRMKFEGFMMIGMRMGYGIEYYDGGERVNYKGCYYNNKRFGKGVLYNRNGGVEYSGFWKDGKPYLSQFDGKTIDYHTEFVDIPSGSFNESEHQFVLFALHPSLKRIVIGDDCFEKSRFFGLIGLTELKSVVIGDRSFSLKENGIREGTERRLLYLFIIENCQQLKSLQIGNNSFYDNRSFKLNNLLALQSIVIGDYCFFYAPSFSLTGLIDLLN